MDYTIDNPFLNLYPNDNRKALAYIAYHWTLLIGHRYTMALISMIISNLTLSHTTNILVLHTTIK